MNSIRWEKHEERGFSRLHHGSLGLSEALWSTLNSLVLPGLPWLPHGILILRYRGLESRLGWNTAAARV